MWTQRDQFTNDQLPVIERDIIIDKREQCLSNHRDGVRAKAPLRNISIVIIVNYPGYSG